MWNEDQRQILKITVGGRTHTFDPLPLLRRYRAAVAELGGPDPFRHLLSAALDGQENEQQAALLMPVLRKVMGWKSLEEDEAGGYTEGEVLIGVTQFLEWFVESKKKAETSPPSAPSAGGSDETPATPNTADSSPTGTSSTTGGPSPSPAA
jgi:hypothetical protein